MTKSEWVLDKRVAGVSLYDYTLGNKTELCPQCLNRKSEFGCDRCGLWVCVKCLTDDETYCDWCLIESATGNL